MRNDQLKMAEFWYVVLPGEYQVTEVQVANFTEKTVVFKMLKYAGDEHGFDYITDQRFVTEDVRVIERIKDKTNWE